MNVRTAVTVTALTAGALYVTYLCILYFMQGALVYPGTNNRVDSAAPRPPGADVFHISTTEANVEALFLPGAADANAARQPAVIFGHGNGEVIDYWVSALHGFQERGVVLAQNLGHLTRVFRRSSGPPTNETGLAPFPGVLPSRDFCSMVNGLRSLPEGSCRQATNCQMSGCVSAETAIK